MKTKLIFAGILLSTVLFASTLFGQNLTERESEIYYAYLDAYFNIQIESTEEAMNNVYSDLINRYGTTRGEINEIINKVLKSEPTEWERQVGDEFWGKMGSLGGEATLAEYDRVFSEVTAKYGISTKKLQDIAFRTML